MRWQGILCSVMSATEADLLVLLKITTNAHQRTVNLELKLNRIMAAEVRSGAPCYCKYHCCVLAFCYSSLSTLITIRLYAVKAGIPLSVISKIRCIVLPEASEGISTLHLDTELSSIVIVPLYVLGSL